MKKIICFILLFANICSTKGVESYTSQKYISGRVIDIDGTPIEFVNIYIKGTIDGTTSNGDGSFILETNLTTNITLIASFIGYKEFSMTADINTFDNITITLKPLPNDLNEVVVYAGNYLLKTASSLEQKNTIDLVTTAGSEGDLYKAITLLPGTQAPDVDGRLLVRGGSSRETQTYIDGMHVLSPYTATAGNMVTRGRYSPFLFEGINFSMGGYSSEYSQSLSAILPLETKNESKQTKIGIDIMNVSLGGGGTEAWDKGSSSFNFGITDLDVYNKVFAPNDKKMWNKPYRQYSGQNQLRFELGKDTYLKTYAAYDKTKFNLIQTDPFAVTKRGLNYDEDNLYLNTTFNKKYTNGVKLFSGVAYSLNNKKIDNALTENDRVDDKEQEIHIKSKVGKRLNNLYRLEFGADAMIRRYDLTYQTLQSEEVELKQSIIGAYLANDFNLTSNLFLNLSSRLEYTTLNKTSAFLPRIALNYQLKKWNFSGVVGIYQQNASNDYLMYNTRLLNEKNIQTQLGAYYQHKSHIIRLELYNKQYNQLSFKNEERIYSAGDGYSRGVDIFINDNNFLRYWDYTIAYSYNDTKRTQDNYSQRVTPSYVTQHNLSLSLRYTNYKLKSIIGVTNRFASGRHFHNPNKEGNMNDQSPIYNSLDVSYTFLAHKRLIVYASASNILNRKNIFGYQYSSKQNSSENYDRQSIKRQQNQSFYIGFFLTIGKNIAYDASNF